MRCFLALFLLLASPAYAHKHTHKPVKNPPPQIQCAPAKQVIRALILNDFLIKATMAVGNVPAAIYVRRDGEYIIIALKDRNTACIIGGGTAFYVLRERKA